LWKILKPGHKPRIGFSGGAKERVIGELIG
jgi:hypothetical protein